MGKDTAIEWCDHTLNPWIGCTRVSTAEGDGGGCDNCYAEEQDSRGRWDGGRTHWGAGVPRYRTAKSTWAQALTWNRAHDGFFARHGRRQRVFCASLADIFDNEVDARWRADLFRLIRETPNLDWLLLTKRIGNAKAMIDSALDDGHLRTSREPYWPWPNVWLGSTIVNQKEADRDIPKLLAIPARVHFLSCEPLLGPINVRGYLMQGNDPAECGNCGKYHGFTRCPNYGGIALTRDRGDGHPCDDFRRVNFAINWVISGGESGAKARPSHPDWHRSLRDQCDAAVVPYLFKQWGQWAPTGHETARRVAIDLQGRTAEGVLRQNFPAGAESADGWQTMYRHTNKHEAGRDLDGRTHDAFPVAA
jgi:protein gp37